ncbi:hypothetical protein BRC84_01420 [Halobacteriales archaeon QS_1_68_44]|nr:MAG: hypothetical protein BRC84_01420 [Halobacteriales archaeon QS_1_68_44]
MPTSRGSPSPTARPPTSFSFSRGVDGRLHVRTGFDVEPVAESRLDVRQHPVREELKHRVPLQQVARVEVLRVLPFQLSVPPLVEFDRDDVGALGVDDRLHLLDARLGDVCSTGDTNGTPLDGFAHCRHLSGEGFTCVGTD